MKIINTITFICLILFFVVKESKCSIRDLKFSEFRTKLLEKQQGPSPSPILPPTPSPALKQNGRVFYPIGYGADPTGMQDSSDAILNAIADAFQQVQNGLELLPGVNDLGGVSIDLQGGNYKINKPIRFPASGGGNVVVQGGTLRASDTFPIDRHLIELWSPNSQKRTNAQGSASIFTDMKSQNNVGIYYEAITFFDILFDSGFRGGGIFVVDSVRTRINNCFFLHFMTEGILVQKGHETFITNSFLGQYSTIGGDKRERKFSGTAIDLSSNDNVVTDIAIFSAGTGIVLRGQANMITGVHCYNKATYFGGVGIEIKAAQSRISNCYLDYNAIVVEDPRQVHITNAFFLGDGNVVLKSVNGHMSGLNIVDSMFSGDPKVWKPIVELVGEFNDVDQVVIDRNNVNGMRLKSTVGKLSIGGNATKWVLDFSPFLLFPNRINHLQYSFYMKGATEFVRHAVTNVTNNVVVVHSDHAVNAVVSMSVDQYNMVGETSL